MKRQKILTLLLLLLLTAALAAVLSSCVSPKPGPEMPSVSQTATAPTAEPAAPTESHTTAPTEIPTAQPTAKPATEPTEKPTTAPTKIPTAQPTAKPTTSPTGTPSVLPTEEPTAAPTITPSPEEPLPHDVKPDYSFDENGHWKDCTLCDERFDEGAHVWVANGGNKKCEVCAATRAYTDEENFADFIAGRNHAAAYNGAYTYRRSFVGKDQNGNTISEGSTIESRDGRKYFSIEKSDSVPDENGNYLRRTFVTSAVKAVSDNGVNRTKYYSRFVFPMEQITAAYVNPDFAEELSNFSPSAMLQMYYALTGDTKEELFENIQGAFAEDWDREPDEIALQRNADGSVSLVQKITTSGQDSFLAQQEDYLRTDYEYTFTLTIKNGKFTSDGDQTICKVYFSDESKNYVEKTLSEGTYSYEFAEAEYDAVSVDSETTADWFRGNVDFYVEGYLLNVGYSRSIGETVTEEALFSYLEGETNFIVRNSDQTLDGVFALYSDPEMTVPFSSYTFTEESSDLDVYVKLTVPAGKSVVITLLQYETVQGILLIYLGDAGKEFRYNYPFPTYTAVTRDGKDIAAELGGETSFIREEGKIHVVLYHNS